MRKITELIKRSLGFYEFAEYIDGMFDRSDRIRNEAFAKAADCNRARHGHLSDKVAELRRELNAAQIAQRDMQAQIYKLEKKLGEKP